MAKTINEIMKENERIMALKGEIVEETEETIIIKKNFKDKIGRIMDGYFDNYDAINRSQERYDYYFRGPPLLCDEADRMRDLLFEELEKEGLIDASRIDPRTLMNSLGMGPKTTTLNQILILSKKNSNLTDYIIAKAEKKIDKAPNAAFDMLDYFVSELYYSSTETAIDLMKKLGNALYKDNSSSYEAKYVTMRIANWLYEEALTKGLADTEFTDIFVKFAENCNRGDPPEREGDGAAMGAAMATGSERSQLKQLADALRNGGREVFLEFNRSLEKNLGRVREEYAGLSKGMKESMSVRKLVKEYVPEQIADSPLGDICLNAGINYIQGN